MKNKGNKNKEIKSMMVMYPCTNFNQDIETILQKFVATKSIRYEQFSQIWRESNFSLIHLGRSGLREKRDFMEEAFKLLLKYILPPYNLQVRVGGIYAMYGMYYTQRLDVPIRIRMPVSCWQDFCELKQEVIDQKHLDAVYIIRKLLSDRAFLICAYPSMLSVDEVYREEIGEASQNLNTGPGTRIDWGEGENLLNQVRDEDNLGQLHAVHEKYHQLKCAFNAKRGGSADEPGSSLDLIKPNIANTILDIVQAADLAENTDDLASVASNESSQERAQALRSIKAKAVTNKTGPSSKSLRYLNESPEKEPSPPPKKSPNFFQYQKRGRPFAPLEPLKDTASKSAKKRKSSNDSITEDKQLLESSSDNTGENEDNDEPQSPSTSRRSLRIASSMKKRKRSSSKSESPSSSNQRKKLTPQRISRDSNDSNTGKSAKSNKKKQGEEDDLDSIASRTKEVVVPTVEESERMKIKPNTFVAVRPIRKNRDRPLIAKVVALKGEISLEIMWFNGKYDSTWEPLMKPTEQGEEAKFECQTLRRYQILMSGIELTKAKKLPMQVVKNLKAMYKTLEGRVTSI